MVWWLIALYLLFFFIILVTLEWRRFPTLLALIGFVVFIQWSQSFNVLNFVLQNPGMSITLFGGYILGGMLWVIPKYYFWINSSKNVQYLVALRGADIENGVHNINEHALKKHIRGIKHKVFTWVLYWPFSLLYTLCYDAIERWLNQFYKKIRKRLENMTRKAFVEYEREQLEENETLLPTAPPAYTDDQ